MFTTIQELEQEIEQFHNNIKESNELINILKAIANNTKIQTESFEVRSKELQDELANLSPEMNGLFQEMLEEFVRKIRDEHQEYQTVVAQLVEKYGVILKETNEDFSNQLQSVTESIKNVPTEIKENSEQQCNVFLKEIEKMMDARLEQLAETENAVEKLAHQLDQKYQEFIDKLEATNMDQLYKCCQDMNASLNKKFGIISIGVVIAIIISVVSLFV